MLVLRRYLAKSPEVGFLPVRRPDRDLRQEWHHRRASAVRAKRHRANRWRHHETTLARSAIEMIELHLSREGTLALLAFTKAEGSLIRVTQSIIVDRSRRCFDASALQTRRNHGRICPGVPV